MTEVIACFVSMTTLHFLCSLHLSLLISLNSMILSSRWRWIEQVLLAQSEIKLERIVSFSLRSESDHPGCHLD